MMMYVSWRTRGGALGGGLVSPWEASVGIPRSFSSMFYRSNKTIVRHAVWRDLGGPWRLPADTFESLGGIPTSLNKLLERSLGVALWGCWDAWEVFGWPQGNLVALEWRP